MDYVFWCRYCKKYHSGECPPAEPTRAFWEPRLPGAKYWSPPQTARPVWTTFAPWSAVMELERQMWLDGICFVHLAPTERKQRLARSYFKKVLKEKPSEWGMEYMGAVYHKDPWHFARFMLCVMNGASTEHAPVMVLDGFEDEYRDKMMFDEAWMIPAPTDTVPKLVIWTGSSA